MTRTLRLLLFFVVSLLLWLPQSAAGRTDHAPTAKYLVLIVMDGFRPDYMSLAPMHHLHALMGTGTSYSRAWAGQLETETPTSHATIATGVYPRQHHVVGFVWRNPAGDNITWMPSDYSQVSAGAMESLIESAGVPTLSDLVHKVYPGSRSISLSGEKFYAADAMGTGADYILWGKAVGKNRDTIQTMAVPRHAPAASSPLLKVRRGMGDDESSAEDDFASTLAERAAALKPRLLLINLPGPDIQGHLAGGVTNPGGMRPVVRSADRAIGRLMDAYKRMGIFRQTLFVVTADHGMVPNRHVIKRGMIRAAVDATKIPYLKRDLLSTAGYIYLRDSSQAKPFADFMVTQRIPNIEGVFYKVSTPSGYQFRAEPQTAAALGPRLTQAYIDLCNTVAVSNGPELVMPYTEDTVGLTVKGFGPHWGTHGGLSWRVQHIPLVLSGPGVRHSASTFPAQMADIAPTVETLMGLPVPRGVDGVVLTDALDRSPTALRREQTAVQAERTRDVVVLRDHSAAQHAMVLGNGQ